MAKHKLEHTIIERKNPITGQTEEIETKKIVKIDVKPDDEFYMVYIKYMSTYYELKYADDIKILAKLCEWVEWEKGIVYLTSTRRLEITDKLKIHNANISKSLNRLREKKLISGKGGEFLLNPTAYWKGSKQARYEMLMDKGIQVQFDYQMIQDIKPTNGIVPSKEFGE